MVVAIKLLLYKGGANGCPREVCDDLKVDKFAMDARCIHLATSRQHVRLRGFYPLGHVLGRAKETRPLVRVETAWASGSFVSRRFFRYWRMKGLQLSREHSQWSIGRDNRFLTDCLRWVFGRQYVHSYSQAWEPPSHFHLPKPCI